MAYKSPPVPKISDRSWEIVIIVSSIAILLLTVYCLIHGITTLFTHLYYFPILLLAYRYHRKGVVYSALLSLFYFSIVLYVEYASMIEMIGAFLRVVSFICVAAVVAYLTIIFENKEREFENLCQFNDSIVFNANVWLAVLDAKGTIFVWNRAAEEISGYDASGVIGRNSIWKELYPDAGYRRTVTSTIAKIIRENNFFENFETVIRTRSGGNKTISWNTRAMPGDEGIPCRFVAIGIDVTGRKQAEDGQRAAYEQLTLKEEELRQQYDEMAEGQRALHESEAEYRNILRTTMDGFCIIDPHGAFLDVNDAFCTLTGYTRTELLTLSLQQVEVNESPEEISRHMAEIVRNGAGRFETRYRRRDGTNIDVEVSVIHSEIQGGHFLSFHHEITSRKRAEEALKRSYAELEERVTERTLELKQKNEQLELEIKARNKAEKQVMESLHEKEVLLREIHHRVKNNLQIVSSLLNLQSRIIKDETTLNAIRDSQNRIKAMALVHEKLYRSGDISHIDLAEYTRFLTDSLFRFYGISPQAIRPVYHFEDVKINIHVAIPLGLIINELVSNALKHGFPEGKTGNISISIRTDADHIILAIKDNGTGIPEDFDWRNARSLGLRLVIELTDQLDGSISLDRTGGTGFTVSIPVKE
jgi:PAS domain S-box-containing protein